ncbi:RagB/SusD family nutrient uptake outer membrane protein [Desertivirga arenae]|uniref:RagB/SusD family nutrient uptake outer membrane protein n=1 Tax=Desertivirga arenae TaxID=2810309 RepID=UPI001A9665AE|nr:RagB/SusD family nutrient uptake outer membrane protein [Pedobacter sp. SYSU D00823]
MKKISNYIIILSSAILTLSVPSCTKLEDESYSSIIASTFTPGKNDIGSLVAPAYANWRDVLMSNATGYYITQEIAADELAVPAKPYGFVDGGLHRRMHEHKWTSEQAHGQDLWTKTYAGVTNCNRVIYQVESGAIPTDESNKASILAELKVLRASYYWVLCDNFGNVPLVDKFDLPEGFLPEQSTRKQVYDFIVKEITASIPSLSENSDVSTYARFNNKWAAYALLAKVYLNAGVYTGQAEWSKCIEACNAIIDSKKFILEPVQKDVFKAQNQNSKEIIYAIPHDEVYAGGFFLAAWTMSPQNQFTFNAKSGGYGGLNAIPQFIDTYHPQDKRLTDGWMMGQQYSSSGTPLKCAYGTMIGQNLVYVNECPGIDSTQEIHSYRINKFEIAANSSPNNMNNDFPLFRYADILMMKAECLLRTGSPDAAASLVTEVRQRSFSGNPSLATVTGAQLQGSTSYKYGLKNHLATTTEAVGDIQYGRFLDELGWEFAAEAHRRQDMIRFGVFTSKSWLSHSPNGANKTIFPIPLQELNKNPKLKQNPGYAN